MSSYPPDDEFAATTPLYDETRTLAPESPTNDKADMNDAVPDDRALVGTEHLFAASPTTNTAPHEGSPTDSVKQQAANVASDAKDAGRDVVDSTKEQAHNVASEAKGQAKELFGQASSELKEQAEVQQKRVASGLRAVGEEFGSMADNSDSNGVASELVRTLSDRAGSVATWLDGRDPGSLLSEVKSYAARKPGAFIAIAAGAGILTGRLVKSLAAAANDDSAAPTSPTATAPTSGSNL